jgi:hypothetical protein
MLISTLIDETTAAHRWLRRLIVGAITAYWFLWMEDVDALFIVGVAVCAFAPEPAD